ncbi:MAG: FHA domain-containing protein [Eggerthellaceae bacterium]|nr:FHA domain-containing protein [Eggerthellaceae bacterium]
MHDSCPICQSPLQPGQAACQVCGFKLLGTTQSFSPLAAPEKMDQHAQESHAEPVLRMVRGPQRGAEYKVNPEMTTIGRDPQLDIFLNDMTVSRLHATIDATSGAYVIRDEQSFNGVWVNNASVTQKALEQDDFVQIGRFGFVFDEGE